MSLRLAPLLVLFLVPGLGAVATPAHAAGGEDNCTGFIDTVPVAISAPGTWCLRQNHAIGVASGSVIRVNADNVVVDCNGHEVDGTAAGASTQAVGVAAYDRHNVTVRNCGLSGFVTGIQLSGGDGHLVEDNRVSRSTFRGIYVTARNSRVQGNRVLDTGGMTNDGFPQGINATGANILDNTVVGVKPSTYPGGFRGATGIVGGYEKAIERNRVYILYPGGGISGIQMYNFSRARDNHVVAGVQAPGTGILGGDDIPSSPPSSACIGNTVAGFTTPISDCRIQSGNVTLPP